MKRVLIWSFSAMFLVAAGLGSYAIYKYRSPASVEMALTELSVADYPEEPGTKSIQYRRYADRNIRIVRKDATHFDFHLIPNSSRAATIVFRNIDVSLYVPNIPRWARQDPGLVRIALTDREWNRQQVRFTRESPHLEVSGGNGFEESNLYSAELARNCLNAGLWEVILFTKENGKKSMYYHGWFDFPLGYYRDVFKINNGIPYWKHWYYLEHWVDPEGTKVDMTPLRTIVRDIPIQVENPRHTRIIAQGEQRHKMLQTIDFKNHLQWEDFYQDSDLKFATFIPPGRYSLNTPKGHEFWRFQNYKRLLFRETAVPEKDRNLHEIEIVYEDENQKENRIIIGGIDLRMLPRLSVNKYPDGAYLPMGIGVPAFFQSYKTLQKRPPHKSTYYSFVLDSEDRWVNHHDVGVDGPVMHWDEKDPNKIHLYLLSYERHSLLAHFEIKLETQSTSVLADD